MRYLAVEFTRFYKCPMTPPPTLVTRLCNSYSRPEPLIHPCHDHELLKQTAATERTQYILGTRMKPQCWPNSGATLREEGCTRKSPTIPAARIDREINRKFLTWINLGIGNRCKGRGIFRDSGSLFALVHRERISK